MFLEHDEMKTQLERKERECEERGQEKEEAMQSLNKLKSKLATETKEHQEIQQRFTELTQKFETLQKTVGITSMLNYQNSTTDSN